MSSRPVLYIGEKNVSSWSMRPWVALKAKGVDFEERTISLQTDKNRTERRAIGYTGRVPVLHHDGLVIPDSIAIIEYVEEVFAPPAHAALWPADRGERASARALAAAMHSGFTEVRRAMSFNTCFWEKTPAITDLARAEAAEMLGYFEDALSRPHREAGPYLMGRFSAADAMYAPAVIRLTAFRIPTAATPKAAAYMKTLLEHPAVAEWLTAARALAPVQEY